MHKSLHNQTPKAVYLQSKPLLFHCIRNRHKTNKQQFLHLNEKTLVRVWSTTTTVQSLPAEIFAQQHHPWLFPKRNLLNKWSTNLFCFGLILVRDQPDLEDYRCQRMIDQRPFKVYNRKVSAFWAVSPSANSKVVLSAWRSLIALL